jgi:hypothetical protein
VTVAVWLNEPLIPVTVTVVIWAVVNVQDSVAVPEPVIPVGAVLHAALLDVRLTTPAKPLRAATVIVEVPAVPVLTLTDVGLAEIVKSWTM